MRALAKAAGFSLTNAPERAQSGRGPYAPRSCGMPPRTIFPSAAMGTQQALCHRQRARAWRTRAGICPAAPLRDPQACQCRMNHPCQRRSAASRRDSLALPRHQKRAATPHLLPGRSPTTACFPIAKFQIPMARRWYSHQLRMMRARKKTTTGQRQLSVDWWVAASHLCSSRCRLRVGVASSLVSFPFLPFLLLSSVGVRTDFLHLRDPLLFPSRLLVFSKTCRPFLFSPLFP
mmetsp:Transcript_136044/g.236393  ORF Transcript_136044/g.236393 Transcript_136044/m.236393 type:complete len:233 (-) Transcript_136044:237-935(-)